MKVYFSNLGCKLNQAEVESLARQFVAAGHRLVTSLERADLHVVNSCTVTHLAARDSRKVARRGHRLDSGMRTVLTGCYASGSPEEAAAVAGVDLVVPNADKDRLLDRVHAAFPEAVPKTERPLSETYVPLGFGNTRAGVKIEDGCNMTCAFCIIPTTRGRQRSRSLEEVVDEVAALTAAGFPEVVITGVQISHYDHDGRRLFDVVKAVLERTAVPRLRVTSIAPWRFDERLLELWTDPRLCRHVHLSLQSGADATLKRMRRPYTAATYAGLVDRIRNAVPGMAVTTDVIVGFPGETDEEFAASLAFVDAIGFARTHVFTYSERPGTRAVDLPDKVPHADRRARCAEMRAVAERGERDFAAKFLGETMAVVWDDAKANASHARAGLTDNYIRVVLDDPDGALPTRLATSQIKLSALEGQVIRGLPIAPVPSRRALQVV